jgi:hypothetical protein
MFKRIVLALTFAAAFGTAGLSLTNTVEARWWRWRTRPYAAYYYGPPRAYYYNGYAPYRTYYSGYYGPRVYRPYYSYPGYYYYGPRSGVNVSVGF